MAVLIDLMAECIDCGTSEILSVLQGSCLSKEDASDIKRALDDMEE